MVKRVSVILLSMFCSVHAQGEENSIWRNLKERVETTWNSPYKELYVPVYAYHIRSKYSKKKLRKLNENTWGLGIGTYDYDENDNWHAFNAMAFVDSHDRVQFSAGYGWQKMWMPAGVDSIRIGAGFSVGLTARHNYKHYTPFPYILPLVSVEYARLSVQTTYIPDISRFNNNGNVIFTWLRWRL